MLELAPQEWRPATTKFNPTIPGGLAQSGRRGIGDDMNQLQLPLSTMPERQAEYYARLFGLPPDRMKRLCDLEEAQIVRVNYHFGLINAATISMPLNQMAI
jgi:hypothetical protein